jgi:hypothetical protein
MDLWKRQPTLNINHSLFYWVVECVTPIASGRSPINIPPPMRICVIALLTNRNIESAALSSSQRQWE